MIIRTPYYYVPDSSQLSLAIQRAAHIVVTQLSKSASVAGLSALQLQILHDLSIRSGRVKVGFLARRYGITDATVSDSIRVLTGKGLVAKHRDHQDGRAVLVGITATGRKTALLASDWFKRLHELTLEWDERRREEVMAASIAIIRAFKGGMPHATERMCPDCRHMAVNCDAGEGSTPFYCRLFEAPLGLLDLRVDCPEFEAME